MVDILHKVGIKAPIEKVYNAIATIEGVSNWWTQSTTGTSKLGGSISFLFLTPQGEEKGKMIADVTALEPNKKITWRMTSGPAEWIGTDVTFDLVTSGEYCIVLFTHKNWREPSEFMHHCSTKWGTFMMSLKEYLETGKGKPSPGDVKIDNWN